jgi:transposase
MMPWARDEKRRQAFLDLFWAGYSYQQIANRYQVTRNTVAGVVWRATQHPKSWEMLQERKRVRARLLREVARQGGNLRDPILVA